MSARESDYLDSKATPQLIVRVIVTVGALAGLWVSAWRGDLRWEIIFAAYFVVQNVEAATEKIIFEIGKRR